MHKIIHIIKDDNFSPTIYGLYKLSISFFGRERLEMHYFTSNNDTAFIATKQVQKMSRTYYIMRTLKITLWWSSKFNRKLWDIFLDILISVLGNYEIFYANYEIGCITINATFRSIIDSGEIWYKQAVLSPSLCIFSIKYS